MPRPRQTEPQETPKPRLAVVGGFLGAGKTTLLLAAARRIRQNGGRVAVITNDQGDGLVDTQLANAEGFPTREVAGGCFCCRLSELVGAAADLAAFAPEVILAEPVGSCIDLAATVIRPLRALYGAKFDVGPLTVLVDPATARALLDPAADAPLSYLFHRQIAEADIICTTKADLGETPPSLGRPVDYQLSGRSGQGIAEWLAEVLAGNRPVAIRPLEVDYRVYADAEGALGWLNWQGEIRLRRATPPASVLGSVLDRIDRFLTGAGARILHLKGLVRSRRGWAKASLCSNGVQPDVAGDLAAPASARHELTINLRARAEPYLLEEALHRTFAALRCRVAEHRFACFRPSPPEPERRMP